MVPGHDPSLGMSARRWEVLSSIAATLAREASYGVGMRELARAAGLNPGTLYHHFASKDDALLTICLVAHRRTLADLCGVMGAEAAFEPRIRGLFAAHAGSLRAIGDFLQVYINLRQHVPPAMAVPLDAGWAEYRALLALLFEEAKASGELAPTLDTRHLSRILVGLVRILNQLHRAGRLDEIAGFVDLAAGIFIRGLAEI